MRFLMRMAAHWKCSLRELGERFGADEIELWLAFDRLYNLPDNHYLAAVLGCAITAPWMTKGHPQPEHYAPIYGGGKAQSSADHMRILEGMAGR